MRRDATPLRTTVQTAPTQAGPKRRSVEADVAHLAKHREGARLLAEREGGPTGAVRAMPGPIRARDRLFFFAQLSKFRSSRAQVMQESQFEYFSKWYYSAIRNYFSMETREREPAVIAGRLFPEVTPAQAEEAVRLLLDLGMIKRTANGYAVSEKHISSPKDVQARAAREHMLELTRMSLEILDKTPPELRQYNALMFTVSPLNQPSLTFCFFHSGPGATPAASSRPLSPVWLPRPNALAKLVRMRGSMPSILRPMS